MAGEELPPAVQDFIANVAEYIGPLEEAIAVAERFAEANDRAAESALHMAEDLGVSSTAVAAAYREMAGASGTYQAAVAATSAAQAANTVAAETDAAAAGRAAEATDHLAAAEGTAGSAIAATTARIDAQIVALTALEAAQRGLERRYIEPVTGAAQDITRADHLTTLSDTQVTRLNAAISELISRERTLYTASGGVVSEVRSLGAASLMSAKEINSLNDALAKTAAETNVEAASVRSAAEVSSSRTGATLASIDATLASARAATTLSAAEKVLAGDTGTATAAAAASGRTAWTVAGWWQRWGTVVHWVVAGGAELLAVLIPAMVALGAAALVAAQGFQMVQLHMSALWTAAEATGNMFHVTAGQALGFGDALQVAQNKANSQVYQALGGTLDAVGGKFSSFAAGSDKALTQVKSGFSGLAATGNQVLSVFDGFVAHLQLDLVTGTGSQVNGLLRNMVPDLTQLGQVLGNVGHTLLNFASDMPGLAEVLLKTLTVITQMVLWLTSLGSASHYLILFAFGLEEIYRWGSPVLGFLSRLGLGFNLSTGAASLGERMIGRYISVLGTIGGIIPRIAGALMSFAGIAVSAMGKVVPGAAAAGTAFQHWGAQMTALAKNPVAMAWAGGLVIAIVAVGIALDKVRNSTQQFIDTTNRAVASASNLTVMDVLAAGLAGATAKISQQQTVLQQYSPAMQKFAAANASGTEALRRMEGPLAGVGQGASNVNDKINMFVGRALAAIPGASALGRAYEHMTGASQAATSIAQLTTAQKQWISQSVNVVQGAAAISKQFGTNFVGSLELAQTAGVNLTQKLTGMSQAAVINRIRIADLVAGYKAMGQGNSAISADMTDLAIQSGLAATKVSQLNQAMQQYMQNVTGGTGGLASFVTSLQNIGTVVGRVSNNLGQASQISLSTNAFAKALKSMGGQGAQAWTNFNQVVGSTAPQLISWFNTAGAEGVLTGQKMRKGVLDVLSALTGFAKDSPAAQAEVLALARSNGISATSFADLKAKIKGAHASVKDLNGVVGNATGKMANLEKVASNLGTVMSSQVVAAMDKAKLAASGLSTAASNLANDFNKPHTPASKLNTDIGNIYKTVLGLTGSKQTARDTTQAYADSFGKAGDAAFKAWQKTSNYAPRIPKAMADGINAGRGAVSTAANHLGEAVTQGVDRQNLPGKMQTKGHQSGQGLFSGLGSMLGQIGHWALTVNSTVSGYLNRLPGQLFSIGASAARSVASGISSAIGSVLGAAASLANAIPNTVKKLLGMASPSKVLARLGQQINAGLIQGLEGSASQVRAAVSKLITDVKMAYNEGLISYGEESALTKWYRHDNTKLQRLARERSKILKEIKAAEAFAKTVQGNTESTYSLVNAAGTGGAGTFTGATILATLRQDLANIKTFKSNIAKLAKMGLNHAYLRQLINAGPDQGGPIAAELAAGGWSEIQQINSVEAQIAKQSRKLGRSAADILYDSGKQAGKGFLSGLQAQKRNIEKLMEDIAKDMVKALKRELGIKSPSSVMRPHGQAVVDGIIAGIYDRLPALDTAMRHVGVRVHGGDGSSLIPVRGGGGTASQPIEMRITVMLDGKQIQTSTQKQSLRYNKRNLSNGLALPR